MHKKEMGTRTLSRVPRVLRAKIYAVNLGRVTIGDSDVDKHAVLLIVVLVITRTIYVPGPRPLTYVLE